MSWGVEMPGFRKRRIAPHEILVVIVLTIASGVVAYQYRSRTPSTHALTDRILIRTKPIPVPCSRALQQHRTVPLNRVSQILRRFQGTHTDTWTHEIHALRLWGTYRKLPNLWRDDSWHPKETLGRIFSSEQMREKYPNSLFHTKTRHGLRFEWTSTNTPDAWLSGNGDPRANAAK